MRYGYTSRSYRGSYYSSQREQLTATFAGFDQDILDEFYKLTPRQLSSLFGNYERKYGRSAASYARKTYPGWKSGGTRPSAKTVGRLLESLPEVLGFEAKCELLRKLRVRHRKPESHILKVSTADWQESVVPLVKRLILKAHSASLPASVEQRLTWLSNNDAKAAQALLARSEVYEGALSVSLLKHEFSAIESALSVLTRSRVKHTITLPYGNIHLNIKRAKHMPKDDDQSLTRRDESSPLFKPRAEDLFDDVFSSLDEQQAGKVKAKAAEESMRIIAEKKRAEIKTANARHDIRDFIENADGMEKRKKDYQMKGRFESASGSTEIQVGRNWSQTLLTIGVVVAILIIVALYALKG
jgi:hypothetical protein